MHSIKVSNTHVLSGARDAIRYPEMWLRGYALKPVCKLQTILLNFVACTHPRMLVIAYNSHCSIGSSTSTGDYYKHRV